MGRDQFQLLEHFTLAIKDDSARPQIAQLTELGLVELTRKSKVKIYMNYLALNVMTAMD